MKRIVIVGYGVFAHSLAFTLSLLSNRYEIIMLSREEDLQILDLLKIELPNERLLETYGVDIHYCKSVKVKVLSKRVIFDNNTVDSDIIVVTPRISIAKYGNSYRGLNLYTILSAKRDSNEIWVNSEEIHSLMDHDMWEALLNRVRNSEIRIRRREYPESSLKIDLCGISLDGNILHDIEISRGIYLFGSGIKLYDINGVPYMLANPSEEYRVGILLALSLITNTSLRYKPIRITYLPLENDTIYMVIGVTSYYVERVNAFRIRDDEKIIKVLYDPKTGRIKGIQIITTSEVLLRQGKYYISMVKDIIRKNVVDLLKIPDIYIPGASKLRNLDLLLLEGIIRRLGYRELRAILTQER